MIANFLTVTATAAALFAATVGSGFAASSDWDRSDFTAVRLISAVDGAAGLDSIPVGLEFRLEPGWKIYWRSPGDAGLPPIPDWSASSNVEDVAISWPRPERFSIFGLETFGYKDHVVLPLAVKPARPGEAVHLAGDLSYLACSDICVPFDAKLSLDIAAGDAAVSDEAPLINRFTSAVPRPAAEIGVSVAEAGFAPDDNDLIALRIAADAAAGFADPDLIVEGPEGSYFGKPKVTISPDGRRAVFDLVGGNVDQGILSGELLTVTLLDRNMAVEDQIVPKEGLPASGSGMLSAKLLGILALALLGGLILNLMPCVLPVLSMKLLTVIGHGGGDRGHVRRGFLASAAGIVTAFLVLAGSLAGLKQAGVSIGWGIQFQQPVFLAAMVVLVTLFAANMLGLFQIRLPHAVSDVAATAGRHRKGLMGHFITGIFATILATPCSAPFLGTAVGFGLSQGPVEIFAVFLALGLGLSAPYLLVAALPGIATAMPRPGPWMDKVKAVLALALIGTAVWLLSVLDNIAGRETTLLVGAMAVLILAVYATRRWMPKARVASLAPVLALILSAAAIALPITREAPSQKSDIIARDAFWIPFDEAAIARHVAEGKTVFVDVTADWCITCQFNKKSVVEAEPVAGWLQGPGVIAMRADWTRPSDEISRYLNKFGRYGIPFNVVYGPDAPQGVPLPELLSSDAVIAAAEAADTNIRIARD